tara:strand:+ start:3433 stop:3855 length:423 start_codon:yes stop_codon:yes gene_type:complete
MGYTNYWYQERPFTDTEWAVIKSEYCYLVGQHELQNEMSKLLFVDEGGDIDTEIILNGIGQDSHETFCLYKDGNLERISLYEDDDIHYNFCKTAEKAYDIIVWHLLMTARVVAPDAISIKRDRVESQEFFCNPDRRNNYE